jgi:hypothetical protein
LNTDQNLPEPNRDWRGHDFWPPAKVLEAIPALYATEHQGAAEKVVYLHYFAGACDWWVVELDSVERPHHAFGYACLGDPAMREWGYIDLHELASIFRPPSFGDPLPGGLTRITPALIVERELGWTPRPAREVIPHLR